MEHSADGKEYTIRVKEHTVRVYNDPNEDLEDDLRPEYDFDYSKARPNPYAARARERLRVKEQARQEAEEARK